MKEIITTWNLLYLLAFGGGLLLTLLTTPLCKRLAVRAVV